MLHLLRRTFTPTVTMVTLGLAMLVVIALSLWALPVIDSVLDALRAEDHKHFLSGEPPIQFGAVDSLQRALRALVAIGLVTAIISAILLLRVDGQERHLAESRQALDASESRYRKIFEIGTLPMFVIDPEDEHIVAINPAACRLYGYDEASLLGKPLSLLATNSPDERRATIRDVLAGNLQSIRTRHRLGNGQAREIELVACPIPSNGRTLIFNVARDVTEADALRRRLQDMERIESLGRLAGGMAHDFNNIITVIAGYADIIARQTPVVAEAVDEIRRSTDRAASLTGQLLAFSRRQPISPRTVDLASAVDDTKNMIRRLLREDIEVRTRLTRETYVNIDPGHLTRILLNLAANANDAMPCGGSLTITVDPAFVDAAEASALNLRPGGHVRLVVADDGIGMSPEVLSRVFEPFFTTKEAGRGIGLGLSTVRSLVGQSSGHLAVASRQGAGTTVTILLPISSERPQPVTERPMTEGRRGCTVLLVEDDARLRGLLRSHLTALDHRVIEASNGEEALAAFSRAPIAPDLVITDFVMPKMGGGVLATRLRATRADPPILFITGYAGNELGESGVRGAKRWVLQKPFNRGAFTGMVQGILDTVDIASSPQPREAAV